MENITPGTLWAAIAAVLAAIVLIANAVEKIVGAVKCAKAPGAKQDERIAVLENWREEVDRKLDHDLERFEAADADNRVTQMALLALLDHGIDGNNVEQLQKAKEELRKHLINR